MTQISSLLFVIYTYLSVAIAVSIYEKCTSHEQCPVNARCRPSGCDGYTCRCDVNFVSNDEKSSCLPARRIGYSCNSTSSKCLSHFALCEDSACRCNDLMEVTPDGRCKDPFYSVLEESCQTSECAGGTVCQGGTCVCPEHLRRLTDEEFWIDPMNTDTCIDKDFSVHLCNGTQINIPEGLITTPIPPTASLAVSTTDPSLSASLANAGSIITDTKIYETCTKSKQCPEHAQCRPQGCKGYSCLCDEGFMATPDRTYCVKASKISEPCNTNTSCISPFAFCDGVCRCLDVFVPSSDGRCKLPDISFVGEECSTDECEYPAKCVGGSCQCVGEYRAITTEEFWIDPTNIWQCAKNDTSLATCKGMEVTKPTAVISEETNGNTEKHSDPVTTEQTTSTSKKMPTSELDQTTHHDRTTTAINYTNSRTTLVMSTSTVSSTVSTSTASSTVSTPTASSTVSTSTASSTVSALMQESTSPNTHSSSDVPFVTSPNDLTTITPVTSFTSTKKSLTTTVPIKPSSIVTENDSISTSVSTVTNLKSADVTTTTSSKTTPTAASFLAETTSSKSLQSKTFTTTTEVSTMPSESTTGKSEPSKESTTRTKQSKESASVSYTRKESVSYETERSSTIEVPTNGDAGTSTLTESGSVDVTNTSKATTSSISAYEVVKSSTPKTDSPPNLTSNKSGFPSKVEQIPSTPSGGNATLSSTIRTVHKNSSHFPFGPGHNDHDHYLCESHSFICSEILCIPSSWVCDGERNCPDGRDESLSICNEDRVCPADEYKCSNFRCIPGSWLCDGEVDCPLREDESAAAGCLTPNTTLTNTTQLPEDGGREPAEKSYTATASLGSLESIAIAAAAGLVLLINIIGIILALTRRKRRKIDKNPPSMMNTSVTSSEDTESANFKIPRPNVLYPPYYVKDDWNTWNSSHFTQYAEQMYALDEHSDFYPGSLKTL
ncbi:serine-rich adhesin for platelets-like isoform X2 [Saccostrea cucullata]|uniref:serine-rich adhesin for platelets-like isoform X2 n=1 Tax=Saccostrea cuccullata TaxID=36930 RepID=UPI002ED17513